MKASGVSRADTAMLAKRGLAIHMSADTRKVKLSPPKKL